jgi:hypothetical protein
LDQLLESEDQFLHTPVFDNPTLWEPITEMNRICLALFDTKNGYVVPISQPNIETPLINALGVPQTLDLCNIDPSQLSCFGFVAQATCTQPAFLS